MGDHFEDHGRTGPAAVTCWTDCFIDTALGPDLGVHGEVLTYKLDINRFSGNRDLQIIIDNILADCHLLYKKKRGLGADLPLLSPLWLSS